MKSGGRFNRILVYRRLAGVQQVSIDGAAFTSAGAGIYTPAAGMKFIRARLQGGGGAGGGSGPTTAAQMSFGTGGGAGGYAESVLISGLSGVAVTVGAGGVQSTNTVGGNGGDSSIGALVVAQGGIGGVKYGPTAPPLTAGWGNSAYVVGSTYLGVPGADGGVGFMTAVNFGFAGAGANSVMGKGSSQINGSGNGQAAQGYGGGGGGAMSQASAAAYAGGAGFDGLVIIEEYV